MSLRNSFPSFDYIIQEAVATAKRFPLSLVGALAETIVCIYLIEHSSTTGLIIPYKLMMTFGLVVPLSIALVIFGETRHWSQKSILGLQAISAVLAAAYYFSLPAVDAGGDQHAIRFLLLFAGLHFMVASLPWIGGRRIEVFWQFNKSLALRFLLAALYSAVLFTGLVIAVAAADHLFGFEIDEDVYGKLWCIMGIAFNTWVFLAGIPKYPNNPAPAGSYPTGLKIFTQYILLPLVAVYFAILIAYEIKIIVEWNWPKGWVSQLVLWYSVVGILSMLLLYPLRERAENRWIQVFSKWFFRALIPLAVMLLLAIFRRLSEYGITEPRYFVLAMAVGLCIVVVYFIFSRAKDIRVIPAILCLIAFLSAYGPTSAFTLSRISQENRLENLLMSSGLLVDGSLQKSSVDLPFEQRKQMSSVVSYLADHHGLSSFSDWLADTTLERLDTLAIISQREEIASQLGFVYVSSWRSDGDWQSFSLSTEEARSVDIEGYEYLIPIDFTCWVDSLRLDISQPPYGVIAMPESSVILNICLGGQNCKDTLEVNLNEPLATLLAGGSGGDVSIDRMTFPLTFKDFEGKVIIRRVQGQENKGVIRTTRLQAFLLIRKLQSP
jgi:hypothetical protein